MYEVEGQGLVDHEEHGLVTKELDELEGDAAPPPPPPPSPTAVLNVPALLALAVAAAAPLLELI